MRKSTFPVSGGALPAAVITIANLNDQQDRDAIRRTAMWGSAEVSPRRAHAAALSKIMVDAHARAKADYADELACRGRAHHVNRPYSYYLGLQMRSGFAEARIARTGMAPAFELPPRRWA